jgi:hypothetical protein
MSDYNHHSLPLLRGELERELRSKEMEKEEGRSAPLPNIPPVLGWLLNPLFLGHYNDTNNQEQ